MLGDKDGEENEICLRFSNEIIGHLKILLIKDFRFIIANEIKKSHAV